MTPDQIAVTAAGALAMLGVAWFFWAPRREGVRAALTSAGVQEAMVLVKGGYTPNAIVVERGLPVRLTFRRDETAACSERVLFPHFGIAAELPEGEPVAIELWPEASGTGSWSSAERRAAIPRRGLRRSRPSAA